MLSQERLARPVTLRITRIRQALMLCLFAMLGYLFDMQLLRTESFRQQAEMNSVRRVRIGAPRGLVLDRDGRVLVKNRPAFDAVLLVNRVDEPKRTLANADRVLGLGTAEVDRLREKLRTSRHPDLICKQDLSLGEVAALEARAHEWPEFRIRERLVRQYPHGSSAAHALGHMGEIRQTQLDTPEFASYRSGDVIGQSGLEASYEPYLRGRDGARWVLVNNLGREIRALDRVEPPLPGQDLWTTIDLDVQRAGEAAFGAQRGAAVAIEARTGAVLAMISRPAYDPNAFAGKLAGDVWRQYKTDKWNPLYDRALQGTLAPGSVFKVVDTIAGLENGTWGPDEPISCSGATRVHGDTFRCWRPGGHGSVTLHEAIRGSCNVYFYHRGDAVGIEGLASWSRRLGLGGRTGIDIGPEGRGLVPDTAWKRRTYNQPWWPGETVSVAIGQGALQVSVLQMATMMGVVGNGGQAFVPHLGAGVGTPAATRAPLILAEVNLKPSTLARLRKGLWAVVNEQGGTARRARIDAFDVAGKTGTAQAPPSGPEPEDAGEHAWFAGYAPGTDPAVVVAVYVERGGHGGETAAPIAKALLETSLEKLGLKQPPLMGPPVMAQVGPAPAVEITPTAVASSAEGAAR